MQNANGLLESKSLNMEFLVIIILLCAMVAPAGAEDRWGNEADAETVQILEQVVETAKESPAISKMLKPPYDRPVRTSDVMRFLQSKGLADGGYEIVDQTTRREALLRKARERMGSSDTAVWPYYNSLRLRLRLAMAFGNVRIASRMAYPEHKSYSIQAMESGIDRVRDAAREAETLEKHTTPKSGEVTSKQLWNLYGRLLEIWDTAKKRDDMSLIRNIDLPEVVRESLAGVSRFERTQ